MVVKKEILQKYALLNAPKNWYNYVRKLFYNKVKLNNNHHGNFLTHQAKYNINVSTFLWNVYYAFNNTKLVKVKRPILRPLGRFIMRRKRNPLFMYYFVQYSLLYDLDARLGLNITFDYIYFAFGNLHKCFIGYITVYSKDLKFQYCGIYAAMINYQDSSEVNVTLNAHIQIMFNVSISFSVIDSGFIQSYSSPNYTKFLPTWALYFVVNIVTLQRIHIQVERLYSLRIKINLSKFISVNIYDGPGTISPMVYTDQYIHTSTFQCVLYPLTRHKETVRTNLNQIMYSSKNLTHLKKVEIEADYLGTLHYFTGMCTGNSDACLIILSTKNPYNVNISISYFLYKGRDNLHCFFAGLTSYVPNNNNLNIISQICFTNDRFYKHQNIYSNTSSILLIIYSYKEYGLLNITLAISSTTCKAISINICSLTFLCKSSSHALCTQFFLETKQLTNVKSTIDKELEFDFHFMENKPLNPSYFKFQINTTECVIMQINHDVHELTQSPTSNMRSEKMAFLFCGVDEFRYMAKDELRDTNVFNGNVVHFNVTGFIQGECIFGC